MTRSNSDVQDLFDAGRMLQAPVGHRERLREQVMRRVGMGALAAGSVLSATTIAKSGATAAAGAPSKILLAFWLAVGGVTVAGGATWLGMRHDQASAGARAHSSVAPRETPAVPAPVPTIEAAPAEKEIAQPPSTPRRGAHKPPEAPSVPPPAGSSTAGSSFEAAPPDPQRTRSQDLVIEIGLLRQAQQSLNEGESLRALSILEEHAMRFPKSTLLQERRATQIFALCAAGRSRQARLEASSFLADYQKSPLAPRVKEACAERSSHPPD